MYSFEVSMPTTLHLERILAIAKLNVPIPQPTSRIWPLSGRFAERKMPLCSEGELFQLWRSVGLCNINQEPIEVKMTFKTFQDYWGAFLLGQGPAGAYVRQLSKDRLSVLQKEIKERLRIEEESTPFTLCSRAWAIRGHVPVSAWNKNDALFLVHLCRYLLWCTAVVCMTEDALDLFCSQLEQHRVLPSIIVPASSN